MDFSAVCRTCLGTDALSPVFAKTVDHARYAKAIFISTGIKMQLDDGLPQQMCTDCINFINKSLSFRRQCKESATKLLQLSQTHSLQDQTFTKKTVYENSDILVEEKVDDILKIELKCEYEKDQNIIIKSEFDSDVANEPTCLTDTNEDSEERTQANNSNDGNSSEVTAEMQMKVENKESQNKKNKVQRMPRTKQNVNRKRKTTPAISPAPPRLRNRARPLRDQSRYENFEAESADNCSNFDDEVGNPDFIFESDCDTNSEQSDNAEDQEPLITINTQLPMVPQQTSRVSCPVCQKDLSPRSLSAHVRVKHGGLRCGYCKTECSNKEALEAHVATCPHKRRRRACESSKESVTCDVCHKVMQRASLRMHQAVKHKGLGPVCEHCGRRFGNKLRLSEHLRAKHGHEKLQCGHCEFKSSSRTALENHERRHRGEKPYVCETCGAEFHAAYLLAQHRHSHRTDRRVKCSLCGASFKASNSLHAHRLARHGARRHHCPLCARAYSCRHYAVKHMRAVHGFKGTVPPLRVDPAPS